MNWTAISVILAFLTTFAIIIWGYAQLNAKVAGIEKEAKDRKDALDEDLKNRKVAFDREIQRLEDHCRKLDQYCTEFFQRIESLEKKQERQDEINKNTADHWARIEKKLDTIEGLLRQRRTTDGGGA